MFLDDQLYEHVKNHHKSGQADAQALMNELIKLCENYWKNFLTPGIEKRKMKIHWDRTFRLWESFIRKLREDDSSTILFIFADLFEKHSYKKAFFANEDMKRIYNEC